MSSFRKHFPITKRTVWRSVKTLAPEWFQLIKSMMDISYERRFTAFEAWRLFSQITKGRHSRTRYNIRTDRSTQILSFQQSTTIHPELLSLMTNILQRNKREDCLPLATRLLSKCMESKLIDASQINYVTYCAVYLSIKYKNYQYPSLKTLLNISDAVAKKVLIWESQILSACKYRIAE